MRTKSFFRPGMMAVVACTGFWAAPAFAQGDGDQLVLEEVIVTAQKRAESLQDVPISIMAITGDTLEQEGIRDPVELAKLVPSLQIEPTFFSAGVIVRIRGFGFNGNNVLDNEVASYLDGGYVPRPGAILSSFLDMETIEILNGPQGTLFGRNAAMGALSMRSAAPTTEDYLFKAIVDGGSFGTYAGTAIANLPVNDDFALRFAVKSATTDGIYDNEFDGKTYGEGTETVARVSTVWNISETASWILRADFARTDGDGAFPETVYGRTATSAALNTFSDFATSRGRPAPLVEESEPLHDYRQVFGSPFLDDEQWGVTSNLVWDLSDNVTLRLINSFRDWNADQNSVDSLAVSTFDLISLLQTHDSESMSHEVQLVSPKGAFMDGRLGFTSGVYYFEEDYKAGSTFNVGPDFCTTLVPAAVPPFLVPIVVPLCQATPQNSAGFRMQDQTAESYAAYASINYLLGDDLQLDFGIRYSNDEKSGSTFADNPNPVFGAVGIVPPIDLPNQDFDDDDTSYRISLSWNTTDDIMLFGAFATGYKAGGWSSGDLVNSETVDDFQLGVKSTLWNGRTRLNATLFYTQLDEFHGRTFDGVAFAFVNAGDVISQGIELDGVVLLSENLALNFGLTLLDAEYDSAPNGEPLLEGLPTQDLTGETPTFAPDVKGSLGLNWSSGPFAGGYTVGVSARYSYTDEVVTAANNSPQSRIDGYGITDLTISIVNPNESWQVDLYGKNIFDKRYYVGTIAQIGGGVIGVEDLATGTTLYRGFAGDRQRFGIRATINF